MLAFPPALRGFNCLQKYNKLRTSCHGAEEEVEGVGFPLPFPLTCCLLCILHFPTFRTPVCDKYLSNKSRADLQLLRSKRALPAKTL